MNKPGQRGTSPQYNVRGLSSDLATMSDFQFSASLDALLYGDSMTGSAPSPENRYGLESSTSPAISEPPASANLETNSSMMSTSANSSTRKSSHHHQQRSSSGIITATSLGVDESEQPQIVQKKTLPLRSSVNAESSQVGASCVVLPQPSKIPVDTALMPSGARNGGFPVPQLFGKVVTFENSPLASATSTHSSSDKTPTTSGSSESVTSARISGKRTFERGQVSEDESDRERRRYDRNAREQQRSQQITVQIDVLKNVLTEANVQFKPDKYSTLVTVVDYVKTLQERSTLLDQEHKKLLDTISKTTEIVNGLYVPAESSSSDVLSGPCSRPEPTPEDETLVFVRGLDYKAVFAFCPFACAIANIDGRFLDCNQDFENITGYTRDELLPLEASSSDQHAYLTPLPTTSGDVIESTQPRNLSLFIVLNQDHMQDVFGAMRDMLRRPFPGEIRHDSWSHPVHLNRFPDTLVNIKVSLVRTAQHSPRFFNVALVPSDDAAKL
jgi:PAS domain-containing protein